MSPDVSAGPSTIEGTGLFARRAFDEGETVVVLGGTVIDDEELARLQPQSSLAIGERRGQQTGAAADVERPHPVGDSGKPDEAWSELARVAAHEAVVRVARGGKAHVAAFAMRALMNGENRPA